jgi:hypothetical protein
MPTGQEAPWRGRRITRTSWQKYFPLPAELRAEAGLLGQLVHLLLEPRVAEGAAQLVARGGQVVQVARARQLHRLECRLRRGSADYDGQVIGRTGGGAEGADLLVEEGEQRFGIEQRRGLLEEEALVA